MEGPLIYFGKRFYDPSLGRWLSPDPQGFEDGPNLYAYVLNNPMTHFDLYGLEKQFFANEELFDSDVDIFQGYMLQSMPQGIAKGMLNQAASYLGRDEPFALQDFNQDYASVPEQAAAQGEHFFEMMGRGVTDYAVTGGIFKAAKVAWQAVKGLSQLRNISSFPKVVNSMQISNKTSVLPLKQNPSNTFPIWSTTAQRTSVQNAYYHWQRHGHEFPGILNSKQYVEAARTFLRSPPGGTLAQIRNNGEVLRYHPASNTFGVVTGKGVPKTMFKPDISKHPYKTNIEYFYAQK